MPRKQKLERARQEFFFKNDIPEDIQNIFRRLETRFRVCTSLTMDLVADSLDMSRRTMGRRMERYNFAEYEQTMWNTRTDASKIEVLAENLHFCPVSKETVVLDRIEQIRKTARKGLENIGVSEAARSTILVYSHTNNDVVV